MKLRRRISRSVVARARIVATICAVAVSASCGGGGGGSASPSPPPSLPDPASAPRLKDVLAANFPVGGAIEPSQLGVAADVALLQKHFSSITAENVMKPVTIGTGPGTYNFAPADQLIQFAQTNSIKVRGHTLLWHQTAPSWFFAGNPSDPGYRDLVRQRLGTYIAAVVTHFRGQVYAWDVVNEVASDTAGQTYRESSPWHVALGPDYIEYAFRAARAADPNVLLFINDYNTEHPDKRARVLAIVQDLISKGVPIDGVGHQLHININTSATGVDQALTAVESLGLINHVTELDVSLYSDPGSCYENGTGCQADYGANVPQSVLSQQATLYRQLFNVLRSHSSVRSVSTWGISDNHTWLSTFPVNRTNQPLLFDSGRLPKWAFWAVVDSSIVIP